MNRKVKRNLRRWATALCAAALCLFGGLPAWGQTTTYSVTRAARSNTEFTFEMPTNNVQVTVAYVDAGAMITNGSTDLYYVTLADALADAADEGDVITLLANQTLTEGLTITKSITLDLNGKTLTGTAEMTGLTVGTGGALTLTGEGTFSTFATAVKNAGGTLTLNSLPAFTGCTKAFELAANNVITIGAELTAPTSAYTVAIANILPYTITSGFATNNAEADPADYFVSTTEGVTMRLTESEAEFVTYVALDETTTKPVITNGGQTGTGSRLASLAEGNVWVGDVLTATTTALPADGITWQWYRVSGTAETEIDGATAATYTVTTDDLGYTIVAKATMAANAAGTDYPAADVTVASAATTAVVKKDNFGTLTAATYKTYNTDKVNYVKVEVTNATTGVEYLVLASDVEIADGLWTNATTPTANASVEAPFELSQCVSAADGTTALMKPSTSYKLYYRLAETADTKHGTTATTNGKPVNEANVAITTRAFDYLVTTQGVTYELSHDATTGRALASGTTATVVAIPADVNSDVLLPGSTTDYHKTATILAAIPADDAGLNTDIDVWKALGYDVTDGNVFNSAIAVTALTATTISAINLSAIGNTAANYGYLKADDGNVYTLLAGGTLQSTSSEEGYEILYMNNGYYTLCNAAGAYTDASKTLTVAEDGMTAILTLPGMSGGAVVFEDKLGTALPAGTGDNAGKFMAAAGQKVVVAVTLPTGFEFVSEAAKVLNVTYGATTTGITLTDPETSGIWTAEFTMPTDNVTVSFSVADAIQGKMLASFTTPDSPTGGTITPDGGNPGPTATRVFSELTFTITPVSTITSAGDLGYELTSLSLKDADDTDFTPTYTIVDASDNTTAVTLPTEKSVKVTFVVPATAADGFTFTPIFTNTYKGVEFAADKNTYFFAEGMKLRTANDGLKFYTVTAISGTTVTVTEIESKTVPANTPFIVDNTTADKTVFDMYFVTTDEKNAAYTTAMAVTPATQFQGTAEAKATTDTGNGPWNMADGKKYYGFNGADFVWIMTAGDVAANRCWIETVGTTGARTLSVLWPDGSVTGLRSVSADDEDGDWYDLNGRKLQARPTKKGVYIKNGTKQVVK